MRRFALALVALACTERAGSRPPEAGAATRAVAPPEVSAPARSFAYPATRLSPVSETLHGVVVNDQYRWLEDSSSPEVRAWAAEQDRHARGHLNALPLVERLRERFAELYYVALRDPAFRRGNRYFWSERSERQEKAVVCWKEGKAGARRVLLDPNTWSTDGSLSLGSWSVSRNGGLIAYQVSRNAADEAQLEFVEVESGHKLERDTIEGAKYAWDIGWSLNDDGVYYTWVPPPGSVEVAERPGHAELRFHRFGTEPARDRVVREKTGDPKTFVHASTDWDDDPYLFSFVRHGWVATDVRVLDLRQPKAGFRDLAVGRSANYQPFSFRKKLYVWTDEQAPRGRVFRVDPAHLERDAWVEIVPEHPSRTLESARPLGNKLVLGYLDDVKTHLEIRDWDGRHERDVELPGVGSAELSGHPRDDEATLSFTTFTQPTQLFRTSIARPGRTLEYEAKVPFDPAPYLVEQLFVTSKDGTRIPAFIVRRRDAAPGRPVPALLYGYGGFASSVTPMFWGSIVPWLEHGGLAAFANLRGGGEYGERWHELGMRRNKQNTFDDFHAVAEHLIRSRLTRPELLAIRGDSNGGLLVGAALTQRPELYRTALCGVPLLDMVRYHRFGSGKTWIEEYGSPEDPDDFRALYAYSPYHHVKPAVRYPSVLLQSASDDDRVDPMHARKFAALLQANSAGGPVLFRLEERSGHSGADNIRSLVDQRAQSFAFAMHEVGLN